MDRAVLEEAARSHTDLTCTIFETMRPRLATPMVPDSVVTFVPDWSDYDMALDMLRCTTWANMHRFLQVRCVVPGCTDTLHDETTNLQIVPCMDHEPMPPGAKWHVVVPGNWAFPQVLDYVQAAVSCLDTYPTVSIVFLTPEVPFACTRVPLQGPHGTHGPFEIVVPLECAAPATAPATAPYVRRCLKQQQQQQQQQLHPYDLLVCLAKPLCVPVVSSPVMIPAVLINLERRPDRLRAALEDQFDKHGYPRPTVVPAVDGAQLQWTPQLRALFAGNDFLSYRGVIGCALSHVAQWQALVAKQDPAAAVLIFEDDVQFFDDIPFELPALTPDTTVIQLGCICNKDAAGHLHGLIPVCDIPGWVGSAMAYIITTKGAAILLEYIQEHGIQHGIDYLFLVVPGLRAVAVMPNVVKHLHPPKDSDIQQDALKLQRSTRTVRMLPGWLPPHDMDSIRAEFERFRHPGCRVRIVDASSGEPYQYTVVCNYTSEPHDPATTIVYHMEPWGCATHGTQTWGAWAAPDPAKYLSVQSHATSVNSVMWQTAWTWEQYMTSGPIPKTEAPDAISIVCSPKYFDPGHIRRLDFAREVDQRHPDINLHFFGPDPCGLTRCYKGEVYGKREYKHLALHPYRYYFMCENNAEHNFVTEKLWEPILAEAVCFYWGAPNAKDIVNPAAFVALPDDCTQWADIMRAAVAQDLWSQRVHDIRREKARILTHHAFFVRMDRILDEHEWVFYQGVDSTGHDVAHLYKPGSVPELRQRADEWGAVAFNTLGFIKHTVCKVEDLRPCAYMHQASDGIYIRRDVVHSAKEGLLALELVA